jgi:rubrerythrin
MLTLEHVQEQLYARGLDELGDELPEDERRLVSTLHDQERAHVDELERRLRERGVEPPPPPEVVVPDAVLADRDAFLRAAADLEDLGVHAYVDAALDEKDDDELLALLAAIAQVEGRHAALVRMAVDEPPAPEPYDRGLGRETVRDELAPYLPEE